MSLFGEYKKEREGKLIVEHDDGFATYDISGDICYIEDIYVRPEKRKCGLAAIMAQEIEEIAREKGCKVLIGSVVPSLPGSTVSLRALLGYGFVLDSCRDNFIFFKKELENGKRT